MKKLLILFMGLMLTGCTNAAADNVTRTASVDSTFEVKNGYYVCGEYDTYVHVTDGTIRMYAPDWTEYYMKKYPEAEYTNSANQSYENYIELSVECNSAISTAQEYTIVKIPYAGENGKDMVMIATSYNDTGKSITAGGFEWVDDNTISCGEIYTYVGTELPQIS